MLVRDDEHIDVRQVFRSVDISAWKGFHHQRGRVFRFEYRINQIPLAVQTEQIRRMSEPYEPIAIGRQVLEVGLDRRYRLLWHTQRVFVRQKTP